ncbi:MAG TPA: 4a-hydroxytetrahydrobiopterin dehydratase [Gammaproteobacteria bacterium]|nr:4a-hydroxytetrahydrobiopterin dehydratase [Gammaproteobacteria bacterium]
MASRIQNSKEVYPENEIQLRLKHQFPHWSLEHGSICRTYKTGDWRATLMLVNAVGHIAEAAFHHPDIELSYASLKVKLKTHSAKGVTNKDFELAKKIEEIVLWRPGEETGALSGLPDDPRYRYVEYD